MNHLAIETSTALYSVGIWDGSKWSTAASDRFSSEYDGVGGLVERCLNSCGSSPSDLQGIMVDRGPGNLTSVRSGLAYANALAFSAKLPLLTASSLELTAWEASRTHEDVPVLVARTARGRGGELVYAGSLFGSVFSFAYGTPEAVIEKLQLQGVPELVLAGTHAQVCARVLDAATVTTDSGIRAPAITSFRLLSAHGRLSEVAGAAAPLTELSEEFNA